EGGSARDPGRRLPAQELDRRAAAARQRGVQERSVAGRPPAARDSRQGREPALRRGGRRLFRPPPGEARHHRLGADQRLARRHRHAREDPGPYRARSLLHRELVAAVRPVHPGAHAVRPAQHRERLLIPAGSAAVSARAAGSGTAAPVRERILLLVLFVTVLVSSVAFIEPSPHDVLMGALAMACMIAGVRLPRLLMLPFLLLVLWSAAGMMSLLNVVDNDKT